MRCTFIGHRDISGVTPEEIAEVLEKIGYAQRKK